MSAVAVTRGLAACLACACAAALALVALPAPAAWAHAELLASDPEDGETVTEEMGAVRLEFDEPVEVQDVTVSDSAGQELSGGEPEVTGEAVSQPVGQPTQGGPVTVSYQVRSADGHLQEGGLEFTYTGPTGQAPATPADGQGPAGAGWDWLPVAGLLAAAVAAVGIGVLAWRRLRGDSPASSPP